MNTPAPAPRKIPRREVLAFIALQAEEQHAPHAVEIREYVYEDEEWHIVDLQVDTEAAVRFWADVFGLPPDQVHESRYNATSSKPAWTAYRSSGLWRGWTTEIGANVDDTAPPTDELDEATAARLREIAGDVTT